VPNIVTDTDILIVGAGPVGLFLANECARRDLRYRIIEERSTQSEHSKALAIFPRTLEIFDMAGLVGPFLEAANRVTSVAFIAAGHPLADMHFAPQESPYSFVAMVPQDVTERLLAESLERRGGHVEYQTKLVSAVQQDDLVTASLDHNGQPIQLTAKFVIGCDGAHSAVRHLLNLSFEGAQYHDLFLLADIETNDTVRSDQMQLCPSEFGPVAIFPMSPTRRRMVAMIDKPDGDAPSLDLVRRLLNDRAPIGLEARSLHWSSYFNIHHRHVAEMRVGRMFVAGDAAHIHSPFGGQGMNTGLQDVWNLAWKLVLALNGHASEELLASYSAERIPVIKAVIETTDFMTRTLGTPNRFAQALRNTVIPMISRLAPFQHAFVQRLSELGITYHGSPIVEGAGERFFEASIRGGKGILNRFLLVLDDKAPSNMKEAAKQLAANFSDVLELRFEDRDGITLLRPDGYIAYSEHNSNDLAGLKSVRSLVERQTTPQTAAARVV
jgi:2-polyprenyl-6-methoxyphenol hydroxylase-like FAD-dependent oxidoreductase